MDPLSQAIAPPANETPEERQAREQTEDAARRRSSQIDEELKAEKSALKKKVKPVQLLVLGQSESGKTTTIKNFQLRYARDSWLEERTSWRTVIFLNLVRSVNMILDLVADEMSKSPSSDRSYSPSPFGSSEPDDKPLQFSGAQKVLSLRLAPLQQIQRDLEATLGASATEPTPSATPYMTASIFTILDNDSIPERVPSPEFCVRSDCGWKSVLNKVRLPTGKHHGDRHSSEADRAKSLKRASEICDVIVSCKDDIKAIWADRTVQALLKKRDLVVEHQSGFFINDVDRIANPNYEPSDSDILHARLRTIGVQEYRFFLDKDLDKGREWLMYDVAGIRTTRAAWIPFFDNIDAIIFLAPISAINEVLAEDPGVNRIQDSLLLWKEICSNKLLVNVQLILFLNKCDLLLKKLQNKQFIIKDHIPDYKDKDNDIKTAVSYFQKVFKQIMARYRPNQAFHCHVTSVIDTKATAATLVQVKEKIIRDQLTEAGFV